MVGWNTAYPGPPRSRQYNQNHYYCNTNSTSIPLGPNTLGQSAVDYHEYRPEVPFDLDCFRFEQTISVIDAWLESDNYETSPLSQEGFDPDTDPLAVFDWPDGQFNDVSLFGHIAQTVQFRADGTGSYDNNGFFNETKTIGFLSTPTGELGAYARSADTNVGYLYDEADIDKIPDDVQLPHVKFSSYPPDSDNGGEPLAQIELDDFYATKDTKLVLNRTKNGTTPSVEFYSDDVFVGSTETTNPGFLATATIETGTSGGGLNTNSVVVGGPTWQPMPGGNDGYLTQRQENRGCFYLKQLKIVSTCLPDEPRFIERLNKHDEAIGDTINKMGDAGGYAAGPVSSIQVEGLAGRSDIVGWGTLVSTGAKMPITGLSSDGEGNIALGDTYTDVFVGITYTARYKSGKLAYAAEGGTSLEQPKKITEFGVLLNDTHTDAVKYGEDFDRMRSTPLIYKGKKVEANTIYSEYDDVAFSIPGSWNTDSRLCLKVTAPYPATFTGLVISIEANPRGGKS